MHSVEGGPALDNGRSTEVASGGRGGLHVGRFAAMVLAVMGVGLCGGNLYSTAERSTILWEMDELVMGKEIGREHEAGLDDVHFLWVGGGRRLHVDKPVFDAVEMGETLKKTAWERTLHVGEREVGLAYSGEFWGMVWVMAVAAGVIVWMVGSGWGIGVG